MFREVFSLRYVRCLEASDLRSAPVWSHGMPGHCFFIDFNEDF